MASNKRITIFNKTNGKCIYCGCKLELNSFHMEHVIPKVKLSGDSIIRLFPSCKICNLTKNDLDIEKFREKLESKYFKQTSVIMIEKYHKVKRQKVKFYFEKEGIDIYGTKKNVCTNNN